MFDVCARLAATGEHQHRLYEHRRAVVDRATFTRPTDLAGEPPTEPEPIRERTQRVQPDMCDDLPIAGFDPDPNRAVTVHLSGALSCWLSRCVATSRMPYKKGSCRAGRPETQRTS